MKITADAEMLDEIFSGLDDKLYELVMVFDEEEGMMITAADPATVQMIDLQVYPESFEEYDLMLDENESYQETEEEKLYVGIKVENFYSILEEFKDEIELELDGNQLVISDGSNRFALTTLTVDVDDDIPPYDAAEMDLTHSFTLSLDDLKDARKKAELISDEVYVTIKPETDEMVVHTDTGQNSLEKTIELDDISGDEEITSRFPLSYLKGVEKYLNGLSSLEDDVNVVIGDEQPIRFHIDTDREKLETLIAPRLDGPAA